MARSGGVTFSAVLVFIGSAFTLLTGMLAALGTLLASRVTPAAANMANFPSFMKYFAIVEAIFFLGFGGWGIASGVGLINTKEWARISMLVFGAILLVTALPAALVMAVMPLSGANNPNLPENFMLVMRLGIGSFYGLVGALGIFWLYFFNKKTVKAQFREMPQATDEVYGTVQTDLAGMSRVADVVGATEEEVSRPLSISIIAWFLLIGGAVCILCLPFAANFFPDHTIPFCFMGIFLTGRTALVVFFIWMAVQMVAAVGLLKLKEWGRLLGISLQVFGILNSLLTFGLPANRARFQQMMESMTASMTAPMSQPPPFVLPAWYGIVGIFPILLVLWFLIARKDAFVAVTSVPVPKV
jgi:hypothetical protein